MKCLAGFRLLPLGIAPLVLLLSAPSQTIGQGPGNAATDPAAPILKVIRPYMTLINAAAGLGDIVTQGNGHTGGCAWVDYNGDYLADLFVINGSDFQHYLFRNEGDGTFTDVSSLALKPDITKESAGVACADIENDGDTDILVAVDHWFVNVNNFNIKEGGPNLLYVNQGNGTFVENASGRGLVDSRGWRNITANFADVDLDGLVDAYLGCWAPNHSPVHDRYNTMYRNLGGSFAPYTSGAEDGLETLVAFFWDADMDLYPELYSGNIAPFQAPPAFDCTDNVYAGGPGGIYTLTSYPGIGDDACAPMGLDAGDIENDGDWDIYCTDLWLGPNVIPGNHLYLGNPDGSLTDNVAFEAEVLADDSWPCNFEDFDLDGWIDLWVGCARTGKQDFLYINERDGTFVDRTPAAWQVGEETKGGSVADYDADGDIDVFFWNHPLGGQGGAFSYLFRNDTITPYGHVQFKLLGVTSNRDAIGATVFVSGGGITQMRCVSGGDSAHSQREQILTFGVGLQQSVDVEVRWPSGIVQSFQDVGVNDFHVIDESGGMLDEELSGLTATYDGHSGTLTVVATSTYGGRSRLSLPGLGALEYDAAGTRYASAFQLASVDVPQTVRVESARGASRQAVVRSSR